MENFTGGALNHELIPMPRMLTRAFVGAPQWAAAAAADIEMRKKMLAKCLVTPSNTVQMY